MKPYVSAVIVAAGNSTRMGGNISKQLIMLNGKTVIANTLTAFENSDCINEIIIAARESDMQSLKQQAELCGITKLSSIVKGGDTRQQSVRNAVAAANEKCEYFAIHDGARPLVTEKIIADCINDACVYGAATAAVKVKDTIKKADASLDIADTVDRSTLWAVQTPQVFEKNIYLSALNFATQNGLDFTDDCQLLERVGKKVHLTQSSERNLKITTPDDVELARSLIKKGGCSLRIGHGYDVHRLTENRKLIMGGVTIPYEKGLLGHSDADVLCHAVSDALLGAAAMGDIGGMFPDTDEKYKDADSIKLLCAVAEAVRQKGYGIANIDATIIAQAPKMKPHIDQMRKNIAAACGIPADDVSVKATTEEGLGFTGTKEGISAHAVVLLN